MHRMDNNAWAMINNSQYLLWSTTLCGMTDKGKHYRGLWRYMLTYGGIRDIDAWAMADERKHVSWCMKIVKMYRGLRRYMLRYGGIRDIDACTMTDKRKYVLRYMNGTCLRMEASGISMPVRWSTIISMYHGLRWYMLKYGGIRDIDACEMINKCKHVYRSATVHAYIWRHHGYRCMRDDRQT